MYELIIADFDTALFRAAQSVEELYVIMKHKELEWEEEFLNVTDFWGHHSKKAGGNLSKFNKLLDLYCKDKGFTEEDFITFPADDFEALEERRFKKDIKDPLEAAVAYFDFSVGKLKKAVQAKDYRLVIGGGENFRYAAAKQKPYKGNRKEKPLIFEELRNVIIDKYKTKVIVTDGIEADDYCAQKGLENYQHHRKTGKWKYVLAYCDKDLKMIVSPAFNYLDETPVVVENTPTEAAYCFALQLLIGDKSTDNIPGVEKLTDEVREKWNLGKVRGVGEATCKKILDTCPTPKEMFEAVVFCYKSCYGVRKKNFTTHTGEKVKWSWKDYLQDSAYLLWMHRDDHLDYNIFRDTLDKYGVKY